MNISTIGTLYGIGAGPGDPELLTIKGLRILKQASVVAFPAGVQGKAGVAEQIIGEWLQSEQTRLALSFPYVQDEAVLQQAWQTAADQVWQFLSCGQDVAFFSEGDVSFYSTFTYLAQTLQQAHPEAQIQTIPGVCSPMAAAASLGIPLTVRAQRLTILPALYHVSELETALDQADVLVLMKVSSVYEQVWSVLCRRGLLQRSYIVERATLPQQRIYADLSGSPSLQLPYFSLLIVQIAASTEPAIHRTTAAELVV